MSIEEPKYTVTLQQGAFELRDYTPRIVAEVSVTGDQHTATRKGFRLLAGYIFGANRTHETIAMTAPVTLRQEPQGWLVHFTMPTRYLQTELPVPTNSAVKITPQAAETIAVMRFSGLRGEAKVAELTTQLMAFVKARGLVPSGPFSLARYNPPWTPWFLRRNEMMLPVAGGI